MPLYSGLWLQSDAPRGGRPAAAAAVIDGWGRHVIYVRVVKKRTFQPACQRSKRRVVQIRYGGLLTGHLLAARAVHRRFTFGQLSIIF